MKDYLAACFNPKCDAYKNEQIITEEKTKLGWDFCFSCDGKIKKVKNKKIKPYRCSSFVCEDFLKEILIEEEIEYDRFCIKCGAVLIKWTKEDLKLFSVDDDMDITIDDEYHNTYDTEKYTCVNKACSSIGEPVYLTFEELEECNEYCPECGENMVLFDKFDMLEVVNENVSKGKYMLDYYDIQSTIRDGYTHTIYAPKNTKIESINRKYPVLFKSKGI